MAYIIGFHCSFMSTGFKFYKCRVTQFTWFSFIWIFYLNFDILHSVPKSSAQCSHTEEEFTFFFWYKSKNCSLLAYLHLTRSYNFTLYVNVSNWNIKTDLQIEILRLTDFAHLISNSQLTTLCCKLQTINQVTLVKFLSRMNLADLLW